eukprot:scaffold123716_cov69-Phaeocystis_antarctica.AAC.3
MRSSHASSRTAATGALSSATTSASSEARPSSSPSARCVAKARSAEVVAQPLVHPLEHVRRGHVERRARVRGGRGRAVAPAALAAAPAAAVLGADILDEGAHGEEHAVRRRVARRGELHELRQHRRPARRPLSSRDADEQHGQLLTHDMRLLRQRQEPVPCDAEQRAAELELRLRPKWRACSGCEAWIRGRISANRAAAVSLYCSQKTCAAWRAAGVVVWSCRALRAPGSEFIAASLPFQRAPRVICEPLALGGAKCADGTA